MRRKPSHKRRKNQKLVCLTRKNAKTVELFHHLFFTNVHFCAVTILAAKFHRLGPCQVDLFSHFLGCLHRFSEDKNNAPAYERENLFEIHTGNHRKLTHFLHTCTFFGVN